MIERLRLKAEDAMDLSVMAACLQDALVPLTEMVYLADERRFLAAFTRFRRECLEDPDGCDGLTLCQSVLTFRDVSAVRHHGIDHRLGKVRLELLTLFAEPAAGGQAKVTMVFAGDAGIQLEVDRIAVTLEDIGEPWAATAAPSHELPAEGG